MQQSNRTIPILIIGAGKAGELILGDILGDKNSPFNVVGFIDDDEIKQDVVIDSVKVLGTINDLPHQVVKHHVEELFIAIPSERGEIIRNIVEKTVGLKLVYKILPRISEVLMQDFQDNYLKYIRKVKAEDLLGGEILKSDQQEISEYTSGQTILITGAAGSIGSELSVSLLHMEPRKLSFMTGGRMAYLSYAINYWKVIQTVTMNLLLGT